MTERQNGLDKVEEDKITAEREARVKAGFLKRLSVHNKPAYFVIIGLIFSLIYGAMLPTFGIWFAKMLFVMQTPLNPEDPNNWIAPITIDFSTAQKFGIIMGLYGPVAFLA